MKTKAKPKLTPSEFARQGGKATLKKHGKEHYSKIAKKRWAKVKNKANKK